MIEVKNLSFLYGKIQALREVSFTLNKGEILSIIGSNGAGKSTLMKCIAGLLPTKKGEVLLNGAPVVSAPHYMVQKGVTLVPEGRWIFPNLSVEDNLIIGGYTSKETKATMERVYNYFPKMRERMHQRAGTLSGGEQQMLAIGRGLMAQPEVLLLDEPSLGLAPLIVNDIINIIKEINADGVTILLVEQNAKKALSIATRACLLETGRIIKTGTGQELLDDPSIVAAYLGGKTSGTPAPKTGEAAP